MANLCDYFPCHDTCKGFDCHYCYCPLYEHECKKYGGIPTFIKDKGKDIKDCTDCILPHTPEFRKQYEEKLSRLFR